MQDDEEEMMDMIEQEFYDKKYENMNHGFLIQLDCKKFVDCSLKLEPINPEVEKIPEMAKEFKISVMDGDIDIVLKFRTYQLPVKSGDDTHKVFLSKIAYVTEQGKSKEEFYLNKKTFRIFLIVSTRLTEIPLRKSILLEIGAKDSVEILDRIDIKAEEGELLIIKGNIDLEDFDCLESNEHAGLVNNGMTCYMNSLLQTLFQIKEFRRQVFKLPYDRMKEKGDGWEWVKAFQNLFYTMMEDKGKVAETRELTKAFGWNLSEVFTQQDVQEFCCILLDKFEGKSKAAETEDFIGNLFRGKMENYIECVNVDYQSIREEVFYDIQLAVKNLDDLYKSFDDYTAEEKLEGDNKYEAEGHGKQDAVKGIRFIQLPVILLLHLRRFEYDFQYDRNVKVLDKSELIPEINLSKYVKGAKENDSQHNYCLFGILTHQGSTAGSGHYITFIRPNMKKWYKFNDENVSEVSLGYIRKQAEGGSMEKIEINYRKFRGGVRSVNNFSTAYMLVYIQENKIKDILKEIDSSDVPESILAEFKKRKVEAKKANYFAKNMEIFCTTLGLFIGQKGSGCLIKHNSIGDETPFEEFISNPTKRISMVIKKDTTLHEFMLEIEKETGLERGTYGIWKYVKRQKWLSYFLTPDNFNLKNTMRMGKLLSRDEDPILVIQPFDKNVKIFRPIDTNDAVVERDYEEELHENKLTWFKNDNLKKRRERDLTLFNSLKSYKTSLFIYKQYADQNITFIDFGFFDKSLATFADIYNEFKLEPGSEIFFESMDTRKFPWMEFGLINDSSLNKKITNICDNVRVIIGLANESLRDEFVNMAQLWMNKITIEATVRNKEKDFKQILTSDLRTSTELVSRAN